MKELKYALSFIIILFFCMIICGSVAMFILLTWQDFNAAGTVFFFGTTFLMLMCGQFD